MPSEFIPPLLPTLSNEPPVGEGWEHEIKYDGYRTMLVLGRDGDRAYTRRGFDWSARYARVLAEAKGLACKSAYLDGETVVQDEQGRSDFAAFQSELGSGSGERFVFYAFDLLAVDGEDLRAQPLSQRRALLRQLVGGHDPERRIQFSDSLTGGGEMWTAACAMGLEGIVSKRLSSRYVSGRRRSWLKVKCFDEGDLVIIGADHQPGKPAFALLARETPDGLTYAGSAFITLTREDRDRFWTMAERGPLARPPIAMPKGRTAIWMAPNLRARVQFLKGDGKLRHATLRELY